jgi:hypothetical protein
MEASTPHVGEIQRVDALLRARFPNLVTRIFEVELQRFVIAFDAALQDADAIAKEFDESICFAHVAATLSNTPPATILREVSGLSDAEAAGDMMQLETDTLNALGRNQDLDFLTRISRVASFRRDRF